MFQNLTGWHALIILAIVLIVFGAAKLPALARSVGESVRILKDESRDPAASPKTDPDVVPVSEPTADTVARAGSASPVSLATERAS
ncbi:MAG: twin-arginine translocase TatA/TatE family subunit [Microbacterium arborescens]